ncbi:Pherophorin [Haematococcus lacustris]
MFHPYALMCLKHQVVRSTRCPAASRCCTMDLAKVELLVGQGCWGAVQSMTVDGLPLAPSYSWVLYNGTRQLVFKATRTSGLWPHSAAQGGQLCLTLDAASACPNLSAFCAGYASTGSCRYSLFNQARTCCPTSNVG